MTEEGVDLQNSDGGFPCKDQKGNPSCLNNTCAMIGRLLTRSDKEAKDSLLKACEWVLSTQSEEGAFVEPKELTSVPNLPPWIRPGKPTPNMPQIVAYLLQAGYQERSETKKAMSHLLCYWQNPDGSFKRKYMVWSLIEVFTKSGIPESSNLVQEAIKATKEYFRGIGKNDPPALLWCLNSLRSAGVGRDHTLTREIFQQLLALRNDDGGWPNEDLEGKIQSQTDPVFSKKVLEAFRAFGFKDY